MVAMERRHLAVAGLGVVINFGVSQVLWFSLTRVLPAQVAAFSLMAVPLVGVLSSALVVREMPTPTDWLAVVFIGAAIAAATGAAAGSPARSSDNPRP